MDDSTYTRFVERYEAGDVPWDDVLPPPEVIELVKDLASGRALDLGCGYGRTALYCAQKGWQVDGIDFVGKAITEAKQRATVAHLTEKVNFHQASVSDLGFLHGRYQLAVDVGCLHALNEEQQKGYRDELHRLLAPDAPYILFARLRQPDDEENTSGILQTAVETLFASGFDLQKIEIGLTEMPDKSWQSGWFWFVRTET